MPFHNKNEFIHFKVNITLFLRYKIYMFYGNLYYMPKCWLFHQNFNTSTTHSAGEVFMLP